MDSLIRILAQSHTLLVHFAIAGLFTTTYLKLRGREITRPHYFRINQIFLLTYCVGFLFLFGSYNYGPLLFEHLAWATISLIFFFILQIKKSRSKMLWLILAFTVLWTGLWGGSLHNGLTLLRSKHAVFFL